ncbi:MAG: DUF1622 domain-containing protein [Deltaproteobacteria bacterium]|nr:MAG: DUF1622 domain-containing protein [Deltaproteobacteria bacterium]
MADPASDDSAQSLLYITEDWVIEGVGWLRLVVELFGAGVIALGVVAAAIGVVRVLITHRDESFHHVRLDLARYLALALEFQLAADILGTAIAPTWDQIGKLGAVAVIRTGLNLFLMHEIKLVKGEEDPEPSRSAD